MEREEALATIIAAALPDNVIEAFARLCETCVVSWSLVTTGDDVMEFPQVKGTIDGITKDIRELKSKEPSP